MNSAYLIKFFSFTEMQYVPVHSLFREGSNVISVPKTKEEARQELQILGGMIMKLSCFTSILCN